ncbi:MAG: signal recognition particle-docking protein FtsY [Parachlamydiaceae bacterium]|nr:signal recognition particle-docking protein FtsY [Parachlamydiaceae bacterium]
MVFNFLKSSYNKVKNALVKTGSVLGNTIRSLFSKKIDDETLEALEKAFYEADLGVQTAVELTQKVKELYAKDPNLTGENLLEAIRQEIMRILVTSTPPSIPTASPHIILIVGVNGNGKTTSVAKLAKRYQSDGKTVLVVAADTFRAAAIEQLAHWASRYQIDIVKGAPNSDPAAVAFDAVTAGKARNTNVVIIDTAGRLHTKLPLMHELEKIKRACRKLIEGAPHETLLVLDATTGQNAIEQAKIFNQFTPISGLILTKLDGSAKGGIVVSIQRQLGIPVKYIGIGEGIDDLEPFDPETYVNALFG